MNCGGISDADILEAWNTCAQSSDAGCSVGRFSERVLSRMVSESGLNATANCTSFHARLLSWSA